MNSIATGMVRPRTTALFFDKLWVHPALMEGNLFGSMEAYAVPRDICIPNPLGADEYYLAYGYNAGVFCWDKTDQVPHDLTESFDNPHNYIPLVHSHSNLLFNFSVDGVGHLQGDDIAHPAVNYLHNTAGPVYLGGPITGLQPPVHYDFKMR